MNKGQRRRGAAALRRQAFAWQGALIARDTALRWVAEIAIAKHWLLKLLRLMGVLKLLVLLMLLVLQLLQLQLLLLLLLLLLLKVGSGIARILQRACKSQPVEEVQALNELLANWMRRNDNQ